MRSLLLRPAAEADLTELYHYIAEQSGSHERAIGYIRRIRAACEKLKTFPEIGPSATTFAPVPASSVSSGVSSSFMVLPSSDIEIGRVFYGGRDYEALIMDENDL